MEIAAELLGQTLGLGVSLDANGGFCPCPGMGRHTKGNGPKDFRVVLDGAPTGYCFHGSCSDEVAAFNKELRRRIWLEENGREARAPQGHWGEAVAAVPKGTEKKARPELDRALENVARFKAKMVPPDPWDEAEFRRRDLEVRQLRADTLGAEAADQRSPEDGKRSPVELY
jgi:hypothetical protein